MKCCSKQLNTALFQTDRANIVYSENNAAAFFAVRIAIAIGKLVHCCHNDGVQMGHNNCKYKVTVTCVSRSPAILLGVMLTARSG